ncbi:hypothetical protein [Saccharolobus caldissimus]|uniref:Clan AA aspartic protease n=1 Tax=Saccharolobus caldissimus TaxID=1702097 RepID=A0AAQ4CVZ2_9CREN|nr:hypothetical protein [Saccharolobus caldissimus]BDB99973.1 hypothetical protein SACC_29900 [Saccharolobus caldissimus]
MVERKYVPVRCFKGDKPSITVTLTNVMGESIELTLRVDTGFDGSVLLDKEMYRKFIVGELPESMWRRFKTLNGYLVMRTAKAVLMIEDKQLETLVLTPNDFEGKNLIGLEVLKELAIMFKEGKATCIMKAE